MKAGQTRQPDASDRLRVGYLVPHLPAISHRYLIDEMLELERTGIHVQLCSIHEADRPLEALDPDEQIIARSAKVIVRSKMGVAAAVLRVFVRSPWSFVATFFRALWHTCRETKIGALWLVYFLESCVVVDWVREERIEHLHISFALRMGELLTRMTNVRTSFGVYGFGELDQAPKWILSNAVRRATFVRCISYHARNMLMLVAPNSEWSKIHAIHLGAAAMRFKVENTRQKSSTPKIVSVGRLSHEKGYTLLLEAFAAVLTVVPNAELVLVGDGPDRVALEAYATQLGVRTRVTFAGTVNSDRLGAFIGDAHVFALASLYEGIPTVLMEAMLLGIPCVAPRITGIPELIDDGAEGLLFTPARVDELTASILQLLTDQQLAERITKAGAEKAMAAFDLRKNARILAALLQSVRTSRTT